MGRAGEVEVVRGGGDDGGDDDRGCCRVMLWDAVWWVDGCLEEGNIKERLWLNDAQWRWNK